MYKWLMYVFILFLCNNVVGQNKSLPEEAKPFLLQGYEVLDYVTGDLNSDKREDAILVQKIIGEDSANTDTNRPMLILIRQVSGKLKKAKQNDSAVLCFQCGGAFGDPYQSVEVIKDTFKLSFYGGSSWRWGNTYWFAYNKPKNNWYMVREFGISYHNTDVEITEKETTIEKDELGEIAFESFNGNADLPETKWKVKTGKTFFYNNPKVGSKPRKAYLIKGDTLTSYRQLKNFVQVNFQNKEKESSGFILKKDLVQIIP